MSEKPLPKSARPKQKKPACGKTRANSKRVGIPNLILRDHPAQFRSGNRSTFENRLAFLTPVHIGVLNRPGQEKIAMLVGKTSRSEKITERNQFAAGRQVITRFFV